MLRTVGKLLLLRVLPRKVVPLYAAWEAFRFIRGRGDRGRQDEGRSPDRQRTGPRGRFGR